MNPIEQNENDPVVTRWLREWKVTAPLGPGFREEVWRRIARTRAGNAPSAGGLLIAWLQTAFVRPAVALAYLMVLLIAGSLFGWTQAQKDKTQLNEALGVRYVRTIDPYQRLR